MPEFTETILVQYKDFQEDHEFSDPNTVAERLLEWLADPDRSPHFHVRIRRRYREESHEQRGAP